MENHQGTSATVDDINQNNNKQMMSGGSPRMWDDGGIEW
jgi:hypothetical protein